MIKRLLVIAVLAALLGSCGKDYPPGHSEASDSMRAALQAVEAGDTAYAIDIYRHVITAVADSSAFASMAPLVIEAMDQLTELERRSRPEYNSIQWFEELKNHPTPLIRAMAWRDLHTYLAMQYFQTGNIEQAEQCMATALELPLVGENADRRNYRDYVQASRIFIGNDKRRPEISGWLENALKHAEKCDTLPDLSYTRSMLGTLYFWQGRIGDAFAMMNDNLKDVEAKNDTIGIIMALNTLTNLHNVYRLHEISNKYASRAIALAEKAHLDNSSTISDAYMLKIGCIGRLAPDSVSYFVAKAEDNCSMRPYTMGQEDIDYAAANHILWWMKNDSIGSDSLRLELRNEAEMRLLRYANNVVPIKRAGAYLMLSRLYMDEDPAKGEAMLDSSYRYQHLIDGIPMISKESSLFALSHYAQTGNIPKLLQCVHDLIDSNVLTSDPISEQQLVENIIELRTANAEATVEQLQLEVQLRQSRIVLIVMITIAVLLMLIVFFMAYRHRQALHLEKMYIEKNSLEEKLSSEVERSNATKKDLDDIVSDLDSRRAIQLLTPDILREQGDAEFQRRFNLLYPNFGKNIAANNLKLSRREEVLCMLIVMGYEIQGIATVLNIERKSVNMARYRLRQKLHLPEDTSLDDFLKSLAASEDAASIQS